MIEHETIPLFSSLWWTTNISAAIVIFTLIFLGKKLKLNQQTNFGKILGYFLLFRSIWTHFYQAYLGLWTIESSLPLHLCGISAILSGIVLITQHKRMYELLYFWGVTGGYTSIVTPEFTIGTQGLLFADYYISHGGILFAALYCTIVYKMRPSRGFWLKIFLWSQLFIPVVGTLNYLLDSNYMYINAPPVVENPFVVGDAPFHLIGFELAGLLHFWLLSLPFRKYYKESEI